MSINQTNLERMGTKYIKRYAKFCSDDFGMIWIGNKLHFPGVWLYWALSFVNSLVPSDTIWWHRSWSTLVQVMACCLKAPSHYLNQCWLIINRVTWQAPESNFTENAEEFNPSHELETLTFEIMTSLRTNEFIWSLPSVSCLMITKHSL